MKVLLTTPDLEKFGGVASYYATLKKYFSNDVEYFTVGSRVVGEKACRALFRLLRDYCQFYQTLRSGHFDLVHLNPSMLPKALVRDGGFIILSKLLRKKVVVFVRGWDPACVEAIQNKRILSFLFGHVYCAADAFIVLGNAFRIKLVEMGYTKPIRMETTVVDDIYFDDQKPPSIPSDSFKEPCSESTPKW
jgi:hypothetical protein